MFLTFLQNTDLRDNLTYLKWYGMIGSTLIMVLIPAVVLIWSAFAMCMGIPEGNQRKKIVRIMIIIIAMFIICHVPKVSKYTGGPPLTRKLLSRFQLPRFLAYVRASEVFSVRRGPKYSPTDTNFM